MTTKSRLKFFKKRINIERQVLGSVNDTLTFCHPLPGLTERAIYNWANDSNIYYDSQYISKVVQIITEISRRSMVATDCSRDVFSEEDIGPSPSIKSLQDKLEKTLKLVSNK